MYRSHVVTFALLGLFLLVVAIGSWASSRTHNASDFLVANRRLGGWLTAFGYLGSATNGWSVLLISAAAFVLGLSAVWVWAAFLFGTLLSTMLIAPKLRAIGAGQGTVTLTQLISADTGDRLQPLITRSALLIGTIFLLLQVVVLLRAGADLLSVDSGFDPARTIVTTTFVIVGCVLVGGLRAASLCDAVQVTAISIAALLLPIPALVALGGWDAVGPALAALGPQASDWFAGRSGVVALALSTGAFGLGLAIPGQPHAMARFFAVRDGSALNGARLIALAWSVIVLGAVLICGWCARLLYDGLQRPELALHALAARLLPPSLGALFTTTLFAAIVFSIASPLLALATQLSVEIRRAILPLSLPWSRFALVIVALVSVFVAIAVSIDGYRHGFLAFSVLGAAFGPLVVVRLSGKRVRPGSLLGAMWTGAILTLLFHALPDSPGDFLERVLPFVTALGIALSGGERRRNPDRADRSEETVHDRVPI